MKQIHILLLQKSTNKSMFLLLQIFKQIHVLVVANFTQILKSIEIPPAICKSFLCQKEIQQSINQSISSLTSAQAIQHGNFELRKMQEICQKQIQVHTNPKEPRKAPEAGSQNKQSLKNIAQAAGQEMTKSLSQDHCKNLDNHKQSLKITITHKRETGKKTKPISQDHHHDCRFSWSTNEESATTCEP